MSPVALTPITNSKGGKKLHFQVIHKVRLHEDCGGATVGSL